MSLTLSIIIFGVATLVIVVAGTALTRYADQLADKTGLGEALVGAVFLGGVTSIAGIITSVSAAYNNHPELAISNAIGGIAAQTLFLSIADITYRKVNLEHASASLTNLMQGVLLIGLLTLVLLGVASPNYTLFNIHPISITIIIAYLLGTRMISMAKEKPMWNPKITLSTVEDTPDQENIKKTKMSHLIIKFVLLSILVGFSGYAIGISGINISDATALSEGFVGSIFTAVATSLPELIVTLAAVRQKALALAVGNIIGGNSFDVLFVAFSDIAYQDGSILHNITTYQSFLVPMTMLMASILIMGLLLRQRKGIGNIGWESALIILIFMLGNVILYAFF
ncbi:sodium:calcium antiporter [Psychroflexus sediminis]|uniref:Cation:H+ antiporter n=1 Tax=Psychroflexus sediminis TaxID=470826 RepID=A0A1G7WAN8_9FLAO|nr:cation transporter [Psychroflexus sediminis]SDG68150.1 cation:H+ antiporter [Psychroflexus sediminis]